jgi:hypothetical protein
MSMVATPPLHRPASFGDVDFYPPDRLDLLFFFHAAGSDAPVDVSGCIFSGKLFTQSEPSLLVPTFDITEAEAGKIRVGFDEEQVAAFPRYVQMSVKESLRWRRTILLGRLALSDWYSSSSGVEPEVEDEHESVIRVAVEVSAVSDGVMWDQLGDLTWDDLGTIEWENI